MTETADLSLSDQDFEAFSHLVHQKAGIYLHAGKKELVRSRLVRRIRECGFSGFHQYYRFVREEDQGEELVHLLDAVSTNLTYFFREPAHFEFFRKSCLPELEADDVRRANRRLRIWSAGCSTGEEPYSIVILLLEHSRLFKSGDVKILGTDLSTRVLAEARRGVYAGEQVGEMPQHLLRRYFQKGEGAWDGFFRVKPAVKDFVTLRRLNLIEPLPFKQPMDFIFCRNVMIYFDKETQSELVSRLYGALRPGGYLFIGHSESLSGKGHRFEYVQPTIYRRPVAG